MDMLSRRVFWSYLNNVSQLCLKSRPHYHLLPQNVQFERDLLPIPNNIRQHLSLLLFFSDSVCFGGLVSGVVAVCGLTQLSPSASVPTWLFKVIPCFLPSCITRIFAFVGRWRLVCFFFPFFWSSIINVSYCADSGVAFTKHCVSRCDKQMRNELWSHDDMVSYGLKEGTDNFLLPFCLFLFATFINTLRAQCAEFNCL